MKTISNEIGLKSVLINRVYDKSIFHRLLYCIREFRFLILLNNNPNAYYFQITKYTVQNAVSIILLSNLKEDNEQLFTN